MKVLAREFLWMMIALIFAVIAGYFFGYSLELSPSSNLATIEESVFELELFVIGAIFGFICAYILRIIAWAILKQATQS